MLVDLEDKPAGPVVTITSEDVKKLKKGLKGGRKPRKAADAPQAETASAAHKDRVRGIAAEHGISASIADEVAAETDPSVIKPAATNEQLVAFIERIERVEEERASLGSDLKEIYAELKDAGFDPKIVRKVISLRKMDDDERLTAEALLSTYMHAVGMAVQTEMRF